jgi:hypothetical protein
MCHVSYRSKIKEKGKGTLILMYGRVKALEIDRLLWNLVNSNQRGHQWIPIGECDFCIALYVKFTLTANY